MTEWPHYFIQADPISDVLYIKAGMSQSEVRKRKEDDRLAIPAIDLVY